MTNLRTKVQNSYGQWLSNYEWSHWTTLTTKYELTLPSARRLAEGYYKHLSKIGGVRMFWAAEPFDCKDGYHLHALMNVPELLPYNFLINTYQFVSGNKELTKENWNRIQLMKYNPKLGAGYYCGKYITKNLADYDIFGK